MGALQGGQLVGPGLGGVEPEFKRGWNIHQDGWGFLRIGKGFLGNRVMPSFCP